MFKAKAEAFLGYAVVDVRDDAEPVALGANTINERPIIKVNLVKIKNSMYGGHVYSQFHPLRVMGDKEIFANEGEFQKTLSVRQEVSTYPRVKYNVEVAREKPPTLLAGAHRKRASNDLIAAAAAEREKLIKASKEDDVDDDEAIEARALAIAQKEVEIETYQYWLAEFYSAGAWRCRF